MFPGRIPSATVFPRLSYLRTFMIPWLTSSSYSRQLLVPSFAMSSPSEDGPTNGHRSPSPTIEAQPAGDRRGSDSELSDARNGPPSNRSMSAPESDIGELNGIDHAPDMAESDPPTPDDASEDADFDMEESRPSQHDEDPAEDRPSSSEGSKRKAGVAEDDFMRADPELYGLRRSVCAKKPQLSQELSD